MQIFVVEENNMVVFGLHIQCQLEDILVDTETYPYYVWKRKWVTEMLTSRVKLLKKTF